MCGKFLRPWVKNLTAETDISHVTACISREILQTYVGAKDISNRSFRGKNETFYVGMYHRLSVHTNPYQPSSS
jgi:hypothetical protein